MDFKLHAKYKPAGSQPEAIEALVRGLKEGKRHQVLLGVTGSGKTFTMANVIERMNRPTLVLAHNKTLAAQLCSEFREFFPENAVEFFVSYYDYYQPEAYVPGKDLYIEKDASINDEIDRLRHSATSALLERRDVIVVASVSSFTPLAAGGIQQSDAVAKARHADAPRRRAGEAGGHRATPAEIWILSAAVPRARRYRGDFPRQHDGESHPSEFFGDEIERILRSIR